MLGLPSIEPEIFAEAGEAPIDDTIEDVADVEDEDASLVTPKRYFREFANSDFGDPRVELIVV